MEYVDGQLVAVRDRMQEAKETDGESRTQVLQDVITLCRLLSLTSSPPISSALQTQAGRGLC